MDDYEYEKKDTHHDSHTQRRHWSCVAQEAEIEIKRPENYEGTELVGRYYSNFDEYLIANNTRTDHMTGYTPGRYYNGTANAIPLKMPAVEVVEILEEECVGKKVIYKNWDNLVRVTYLVPSSFEVAVLPEEKSDRVKVQYALVDGKLYDRDFIYEYNSMNHTWQPICSTKIPLPVIRNLANGKIDKKIVPFKIASITSTLKEKEKENHCYTRGIIKHETNWHYGYSKRVAGDVFIDLGEPQVITHIGTIGSFINTSTYPEVPSNSYIRMKGSVGRRWRNKYRNTIQVEQGLSLQTWPVSYRLMYKRNLSDNYTYVGSYSANHNAFEEVVRDVSAHIPAVPIRYLLLKPVSNRHKHDSGYVTPCRMSVAVYGKASEAKKVAPALGEPPKNAVELIEYTLTLPPPVEKQVRLKQPVHGDKYYWRYDVMSKHLLKRFTMQDAQMEVDMLAEDAAIDALASQSLCLEAEEPCGRIERIDWCEEQQLAQLWQMGLLFDSEGESDGVIPEFAVQREEIDTQLMNENVWPALPLGERVRSRASTATSVESESTGVIKTTSRDSDDSCGWQLI